MCDTRTLILCVQELIRGGTKSLMFHVTFVHINVRHCGCIPYSCRVEGKKLQDPQEISGSNVSIADHSHTVAFTYLFQDQQVL